MEDWSGQMPYGVRFDWGPVGARRLVPGSACLVVVDVLSFTTAVSVAVDDGTRVYPYPFKDDSATAFAAERRAELASGRRAVTPQSPWSLSPAALRRAGFTPRLVLPSPNGSAISAAARGRVVAASLRNARAVGRWLLSEGLGTADRPLAVVAAGERWPDESLRPAVEDLLGAGAVIAALGVTDGLSPEARAALAAYAHTADVAAAVAESASGRELIGAGFPEDVEIAVEIDSSSVVPVLEDGAFNPTRVPG